MKTLLHPKTILAFAFLLLAGKANLFLGEWIQSFLPNKHISPDLLLHLIPYQPAFEYVAEFAVMGALVLLLLAIVRKKPHKTPYIVTNLALLYACRAVLITLTPLAQSSPTSIEPNLYGLTFTGMYPSGHFGIVTLAFLLLRKENPSKHIHKIALVLLLLEMIGLLGAHAHYSIDLVGGMMLAYVTYRFLLRFRAQLFTDSPQE